MIEKLRSMQSPFLAVTLAMISVCAAGCENSPVASQNNLPAQQSAPPIQATTSPTQAATPSPISVELSEALSRGLVQVIGSGDGMESVSVTLESKSNNPLEVIIPIGTIFHALSSGTQSMVAREKVTIRLEPQGSRQSISIDAACANMYLDAPEESDKFTIRKTAASEDLTRLLTLPGFRSEDFRVQQFAIWTITDNPGRDEYAGIGDFGVGEGPTKDEVQTIRTLFERAGIPAKQYRALR